MGNTSNNKTLLNDKIFPIFFYRPLTSILTTFMKLPRHCSCLYEVASIVPLP